MNRQSPWRLLTRFSRQLPRRDLCRFGWEDIDANEPTNTFGEEEFGLT